MLRILWGPEARNRVLMLVVAAFSRVLMVHMGIDTWAGFRGMLVQMPMRVRMGMLVGMGCFVMPMLMAMRVGMLMNMQVLMFRYFFHNRLPFPKICFALASSDVYARSGLGCRFFFKNRDL